MSVDKQVAELCAANIRAYWSRQGQPVTVWIEHEPYRGSCGGRPLEVVHSDIKTPVLNVTVQQ